MPQQQPYRRPQQPQPGRRSGAAPEGSTYHSRRKNKRKKQQRAALIIIFLVIVVSSVAIVLALASKKPAASNDGSSTVTPPAGTDSLPQNTTTSEPDSNASAQPNSTTQPEPTPTPDISDQYTYYEAEAPVLFNYANYIPDAYYDSLTLVSVGVRPSSGEDQRMEETAAQAFLDMQAAAKTAGYTLSPYSGYRSHQRQTNNYNASIQRYKDQGHSQEEAVRRTRQYYAIPGTSEHEAGLAMDINGIENSFANTAEFTWLQENAASYGFILRYTKEKQDLTQVNYEPWHYRYVGENHAKRINELGYCLEEYTVLLQLEALLAEKQHSLSWLEEKLAAESRTLNSYIIDIITNNIDIANEATWQ